MNENKQLLVAVWMLTYNHEKFISQAIEGVINQQTNFNYRIYLGEDCSTDNTRNICIEFAKKFPERINLYLNEKNDIKKNAKTIYNACVDSGAKYIALIEADDFWADPYKLQKQVAYLEKHSHIVGCFSDTYTINEKGDILYNAIPEIYKREVSIAEVGIFWMPTVSICFITKNFAELINYDIFLNVDNGDIFIYYLLAQRGNFAYVETSPSYFRQHSNGYWTRNPIIDRYKKMIKSDYMTFDALMSPNRKYIIPRLKSNYSWQLNHYKKNEHITTIVTFLKDNVCALLIRKQYNLAISIMFQSFYILVLRIIDRIKRMVR